MTKYLTTYEELNACLGKKVRFIRDNNEEEFIGFIGLDEKDIAIFCPTLTMVFCCSEENIIEYRIELIEEDNKEENKKHFPDDEDWILEEQNSKPMGLADNINHPSHYQGKIECIDYLQDKLTAEEFNGFLKGNVLKYLSRAGKKDDELEDYKKAQWYMNKLIEIIKQNAPMLLNTAQGRP